MYRLTCPQCEAPQEVSAAKAGGEIVCVGCQQPIAVPKLGQLRELPMSAPNPEENAASAAIGLSGGRSMAFAALGLVSLLSLLGAAFCGVNWSTTEVLMTTQKHLATLEERYAESTASQMIREFEDITEFGVDIPAPLIYRDIELRKQAWGQKTVGFAGLSLVTFLTAIFIGRRIRSGTPAG